MNNNWFDQLSKCKTEEDRLFVAVNTDDPDVIASILEYDKTPEVISAALQNKANTTGLTDLLEVNKMQIAKSNHTMCPLPWNHLMIAPNGTFRSCCQQIYHPHGVLETNNRVLNVIDDSIESTRNSTTVKDIRRAMLNNEKPSVCKLCWDEEDAGLFSKRKSVLLQYPNIKHLVKYTAPDGTITDSDQVKIKYLDIRFGNLCNLKCRYCGPSDSTLWYNDYAELHLKKSPETPVKFVNTSKSYTLTKTNNVWKIADKDFNWGDDPKFWDQIKKMIPYIDRYYFTGGEPSINKPHFKLLELIIQSGESKNVSLDYNSNIVAIPDSLYINWQKFKKVDIGCSIDGIHEMANYLRPPSTWEVLKNSITKLNEQGPPVTGVVSTTISVFNVLHFLDITKWLLAEQYENIKKYPLFHVLAEPSCMSIQVLPSSMKDIIRKQYEDFYTEISMTYSEQLSNELRNYHGGLLKYMFAEDKTNLLPKLAGIVANLDKLRNQDISIIPWLKKILDTYNK